MTQPYGEVTVKTDEIGMVSTASNRDGTISVLEAAAHVLRVDREREGLANKMEIGRVKGKKLALAVNSQMYQCDCGKLFASQNGYAGHKNHCHD